MDKLLNPLLKRKQELMEGLVEQPAQSLHDYHRRVGQIQGIDDAIEIIVELLRPKDED